MADTKQRVLNDGYLIIGDSTDEQRFDADITKASLTPKADSDDPIDFLDGHSEAAAQTVSWTLEGTVKENFSKDGIQAWCFKNSGKTMPFKFWPNDKGDLGFTGNVTIVPIAIGGDVKKKNDQDFSFTTTDVDLLDPNQKPKRPAPTTESQNDGQTVAD